MNIKNDGFINKQPISDSEIVKQGQDSNHMEIEISNEVNEILEEMETFVQSVKLSPILFEEENNLPSVQEIEEMTEVLNKNLNKAAADVDKKLDHLFNSSIGETDEEKVKKALNIIYDNYRHIEETLEKHEGSSEIAETSAKLLKIPLDAMIMGCHFAEKISENLESPASLVTFGNEVGLVGLGIIGIGIKCYSIQNQGKMISINHEKVNLILEKIKNEKNPAVIEELHKEIMIILKDIEHLNKEMKTNLLSVTHEFFAEAFEKTPSFIDFTASSTHLFASHADILTKLMEVSSGLSVAGAIVSLGWTSYQVYQHSDRLKTTDRKIDELTKKNNGLTEDEVYIAYIIQSKLDRMKELKSNQKLKLGLRILNLTASSLALSAAFKGALIASGVAVGATTSIALTGTGVVGLTLLGGVAGVGTGLAVYQNRFNIEHAVKAIPLITKKLILKNQLKNAEKVYEVTKDNVKNLLNSSKQNNMEKLSLLTIPDNIEDLLKSKNPQTRFIELMNQEKIIIDELNKAGKEHTDAGQLMKKLFKKIDSLTTKRKDVDLARRFKNLEKGFRNYDLTTLNVVKKVIEEGLADPSLQVQIRNYLRSELSRTGIEATWDDVLNYILDDK